MQLVFYRTGFDVTKNGVYEDLEKYIDSLSSVYSTEYKYIEPALSVVVKLPLNSHVFDKSTVGDYCEMIDGDKIYYYYVMNCKWKGQETLEVSLALDTLNTYWAEIDNSLSDETHVSRRFKDRFTIEGDTAYAVVDRKDESFTNIPMYQSSYQKINPDSDYGKWYLVYITKYDATENLSENPVSCYCIPSSALPIKTSSVGIVNWGSEYFNTDKAFAISSSESPNASLRVGGVITTFSTLDYISTTAYIVYSANYKRYYLKVFKTDYNTGITVMNQYEGDSVDFITVDKVFEQDFDYADSLNSTDTKYWPREGRISYENPVEIKAGSTYETLTSFETWYSTHKTDGRLVKIRELPYAPFPVTKESGYFQIPDNWTLESGLLKFDGGTFPEYRLKELGYGLPTLSRAEVVLGVENNINNETKLYSSVYRATKLVYDNNTWVLQPELLTMFINPDATSIYYKVSDGMDNGLAFGFFNDQMVNTDYGRYMLVDRSTDLPYFTNEYLNYLRYGKAVDERNAALSAAGATIAGVGSLVSTAASTAFGLSSAFGSTAVGAAAGPIGLAVGAAVGIASTVISTITTCVKAQDTINSKIDTYTHQASSVNGTSDISLLNVYNGNKLLKFEYDCDSDIKQSIYNYFRLYGYSTDEYGKPEWGTRNYSDYFVLEPAFTGSLLWNDFIDDITNRMKAGFRVFHLGSSGYDLSLRKENWERNLLLWAAQ